VLGSGTFGNAIKCVDLRSGRNVVVKVTKNDPHALSQSEIEIEALGRLRVRDKARQLPICHLEEHFTFRNHVCLVFEELGMPLHNYMEAQGGALHPTMVRGLGRTLLHGITFLHHSGVIHCDIKPENILMTLPVPGMPPSLKLIDFNTSSTPEKPLFLYIQTRFYRAPEVILGGKYGFEIDMWSFGCILAEMITGTPLFAGLNEIEQLAGIMEVCGQPPPDVFAEATQANKFFDARGCFIGEVSRPFAEPGGVTLKAKMHRTSDDMLLDLVWACIQWEPHHRFTAEQAASDMWFKTKPAQASPSPRQNGPPGRKGGGPGPGSGPVQALL